LIKTCAELRRELKAINRQVKIDSKRLKVASIHVGRSSLQYLTGLDIAGNTFLDELCRNETLAATKLATPVTKNKQIEVETTGQFELLVVFETVLAEK